MSFHELRTVSARPRGLTEGGLPDVFTSPTGLLDMFASPDPRHALVLAALYSDGGRTVIGPLDITLASQNQYTGSRASATRGGGAVPGSLACLPGDIL